MKTPLKIILVGLPGSGKSTFGKQVARQLNFVFIDLDHLIEKEEGCSIPEIFQNQGEGGFRNLETKHLSQVLEGIEGFVLSTGGGTPCFNENMQLINDKGISVFLDVPIEEIKRRLLLSQLEERPLFAGLAQGELTLKLKSLYEQRLSYYEQAKIKLRGESITPELLISELMPIFRS
jgi:shikimate kinase